ncbi:MAG: type II secretion system protein, partial [Candidatus Gastranaerophilaceae bacterium]|nr:type II secretion system protein [Candidatus Gastranaerophilaceae bacterium]
CHPEDNMSLRGAESSATKQSSLLSNVENFDDKTVNSVSKKFEQVSNNATLKTAEKTAGLPRSQGYLLPRNDMGKKAAFTLAEGATHIAQSAKPRRAAFTLAEVLITLGIIGVVAALTLPTLINNYQKQETISKLKKVYAMLCNTTTMAVAEYGDTTGWDVGDDLNWENGKAFAEKYMIPYLKVARVCENNNTSDCNYPISKLNGQSFNNNNVYTKSYRFYLVDGTFISVAANRTFANLHDKLVQITFDINGQKNPNKLGRDVFSLEYFIKPNDINVSVKEHEGKLLPSFFNRARDTILGTEDGEYCNKDKSGKACLAVIFMDGWEIKDDYPW